MEFLKKYWKHILVIIIIAIVLYVLFFKKKSADASKKTGTNRVGGDKLLDALADVKAAQAAYEKCYKEKHTPGVVYVADPCAEFWQKAKKLEEKFKNLEKELKQESGFGVPPDSKVAADETRRKLQALIDKKSARSFRQLVGQAKLKGIWVIGEKEITTMDFNPNRARVRTLPSKCPGDKCPAEFEIIKVE